MRDPGGVGIRIVVLGRAHAHRLCGLPIGGGEGEACGVHRHVRSRGPAERDRDRAGRRARQHHRVGPARRVSLEYPNPVGTDLHIGPPVPDEHRHAGKRCRGVAASGRAVGQRHPVVVVISVVYRCHIDRLRGVPVRRREGEGRGICRHVRSRGAAHRHRDRAGRLAGQHEGVAALHRVSFVDRHPIGLDRRPGDVVVFHAHRQARRRHRGVVPAGCAVGERDRVVVHHVRIGSRGHGHRLRIVPVGGGEGQARLVERDVRPRMPGDRHRHVRGGLRGQPDLVGRRGLLVHDHGPRRDQHSGTACRERALNARVLADGAAVVRVVRPPARAVAIGQAGLRAAAVHVVEPDRNVGRSRELGERRRGPRVAQLPARHLRVRNAPEVVADGAPRAVVVDPGVVEHLRQRRAQRAGTDQRLLDAHGLTDVRQEPPDRVELRGRPAVPADRIVDAPDDVRAAGAVEAHDDPVPGVGAHQHLVVCR